MIKNVLLASAICLSPAVATAAEEEFWYVGLSAGVQLADGDDFKNTATSLRGEYDYDNGYTLNASVGHSHPDLSFGGNGQMEVEVGIGEQDLENGAQGTMETQSVHLNYIYDTDYETLSPYVGVGVGVTKVELDGKNPTGAKGEDEIITYQALAGISYDAGIPSTEFFIGYRYVGAFEDPIIDNIGGGETIFDYEGHEVEVGVQVKLN